MLCTAKFLLHLFTSVRHYGYFRDELYYLDLARHLDWGYVDCAPLVAIYAKAALLMGGSLAALRVIPALAGTALVAITNQRFGVEEENTPIYLCRGALFDIQKIWWHYHHWN